MKHHIFSRCTTKKKEKKKRIQRCTFNLTCIASMRKIQRGDAVETFGKVFLMNGIVGGH
jgi:hypothetical protein